MKRSLRLAGVFGAASLVVLTAVACDQQMDHVEGRDCSGPQHDLNKEPHYPVDYIHRWQRDGCDVRLDIIMSRQGADACGGPKVADILMGTPLGEPHDESPARIYIKDPEGVFGNDQISQGFDGDADVPEDATDTAYRWDGRELWMVLDDDRFLYLVDDHTERWPLVTAPPGCG